MKRLKRFINLVLLLTVLIFVQQAQATPLPTSTYAGSQWQGSRSKNMTTDDGSIINYHVAYAVYDTLGSMGVQEGIFVNSVKSSGMDQYLYVYQVFNEAGSEASIASFSIFNIDKTVLDVASQNISAKQDDAASVEPSYNGLESGGTKVVWEFAGLVLLEGGDHSWYLVVSSKGGPVKGDFEISTSTPPVPPPIPEPATVALLSTGALMIAGRRKRK